MDEFLVCPFELEQVSDVVSASMGILMIAFPSCLLNKYPGMGSIIAAIWAMDNTHHFMLTSIRFLRLAGSAKC